MSDTSSINLASVAVMLEEFAATNEGVTAEVMPATSLGLDPAEVSVVHSVGEHSRVIVATDPTPNPLATQMVELIGAGLAPFEPATVDFGALPDPAAVVVMAGEAVIAVVFVSELAQQSTHEPSDSLVNIGVLRHVPLEVAAELGRARVTMEEILQYGPGSIIELDRAAGAPVDVVVNGSLVARGEVVVLGEEYGIRVTEILARR